MPLQSWYNVFLYSLLKNLLYLPKTSIIELKLQLSPPQTGDPSSLPSHDSPLHPLPPLSCPMLPLQPSSSLPGGWDGLSLSAAHLKPPHLPRLSSSRIALTSFSHPLHPQSRLLPQTSTATGTGATITQTLKYLSVLSLSPEQNLSFPTQFCPFPLPSACFCWIYH